MLVSMSHTRAAPGRRGKGEHRRLTCQHCVEDEPDVMVVGLTTGGLHAKETGKRRTVRQEALLKVIDRILIFSHDNRYAGNFREDTSEKSTQRVALCNFNPNICLHLKANHLADKFGAHDKSGAMSALRYADPDNCPESDDFCAFK